MISKLNGTLVYVQVDRPTKCFEKDKGEEWKASIVVDEDTADEFNELYPKQTAAVVKTSEFEEKYKIEPPFPDAKKQYVITLRKNTLLSNGEPVPEQYQPKVFIVEDGEKVEITQDRLVANGSTGAISIDHFETKSYGNVARLKNIMVKELVEYVRTARASNGSEFDDELPAETKKAGVKKEEPKAEAPKPAKAPVKEKPAAAKGKKVPVEEPADGDETDFPF